MALGSPEFVDNPENRCPVVLLLDTSGSMKGAPIDELRDGLAAFKSEIEQDELAALRVEVAIVGFGGDAKLVQDFVTVDQLDLPPLVADGQTPMGAAIELALDRLEARKSEYRAAGIQYYRPWVFLLTDGEPTDGVRWQDAARRVHDAESARRLAFFAVGVGQANLDILGQISPPNRPPLMLKGLQFKDLFQWLSASVKRVSTGKVGGDMVELPSVAGWAQVGS
jgi:uncharacterized protein YegL